MLKLVTYMGNDQHTTDRNFCWDQVLVQNLPSSLSIWENEIAIKCLTVDILDCFQWRSPHHGFASRTNVHLIFRNKKEVLED